MKVLLTGGSGNLGQTLVPKLRDKGDTPVILDVRAPPRLNGEAMFIEGSILDRSKLTETFRGCDCIIHIAAWHGIHEDRGEKGAYDSSTSMCAAPSRFSKPPLRPASARSYSSPPRVFTDRIHGTAAARFSLN
jgi:nucleoside-diphosphate-sugar epimerase